MKEIKKLQKTPLLFVLPFLIYILVFCFQLSLAAQTTPQEAKDIVAQCVTRMGGEAAIQNFANFKAEGDMLITFGTRQIPGKVTVIYQGEKIYNRADISFGSETMKAIRAYDGKVAWSERMGHLTDEPALNFESDARHTMALLLAKNTTYALGTTTEIDGKKVVAIEATTNDNKTTFYITTDTYTVLEIVYKDLYFGDKEIKEMIEKRISYSDYKEKDGQLFPYTWKQSLEGKSNVEFHFTQITFSPTVSPSLFTRPDEKMDLRVFEEKMD